MSSKIWVLQNSALGPLVYLIFVCKWQYATRLFKTIMDVDDTKTEIPKNNLKLPTAKYEI